MGCVTSKHRIKDNHNNIFEVSNVNDSGQMVSKGHLEITSTELILHHNRPKGSSRNSENGERRQENATRWPLKCLRKYGCDSELFTFECGRKCPTGEGIYAFHCNRAEQLFNLLQQQLSENNIPIGENFISPNGTINEYPVGGTGPMVHRRNASQPESYLNPSNNTVVTRPHPSLSRPGSMSSSNGPLSPPTMSPPPSANEISCENNNNKRGSLIPEHSYTNNATIAAAELENTTIPYINLNAISSPMSGESYVNFFPETSSHLYMNVNPADSGLVTPNKTKEMLMPTDSERPIYVNIEKSDVDSLRSNSTNLDLLPISVPQTPTYPNPEIHYIELELEPPSSNGVKPPNTLPKPDSPTATQKKYVTIDFDRTSALSHSTNPRVEVEEGVRKTRHNFSKIEVTVINGSKQRTSLSD